LQKQKAHIADTGNSSIRTADNWFQQQLGATFTGIANRIMDDSMAENALVSPPPHPGADDYSASSSSYHRGPMIPQAERMASLYGAISPSVSTDLWDSSDKQSRLVKDDHLVGIYQYMFELVGVLSMKMSYFSLSGSLFCVLLLGFIYAIHITAHNSPSRRCWSIYTARRRRVYLRHTVCPGSVQKLITTICRSLGFGFCRGDIPGAYPAD
jgi:hypothetical protein